MKRHLIRLLALLMGASLCLSAPALAARDREEGEPIRVGLYYGGSALAGANLDNSVGSGYRFGYFDSDRSFVDLARTSAGEGQISVVKAQNVYFDGSNYTDSGSGAAVGCYHIQLPGSYWTFEEAQAAANQYTGGFVAWIDGSYEVRSGAYLTKDAALAGIAALGGGTVVGTSSYAVTVVRTGTSTVLFQFDGGSRYNLGIMPDVTGEDAPLTWFKGYRYYGGFEYQRSGGNLTVVNLLPLETYVKGVIPYEMSPDWPLEALKAQAVSARTYAARYLTQAKHAADGFDVCNTVDCQVYHGGGSTVSQPSAASDQAVDDTAGIYAWYNGSYAETYFFSSDGGGTENPANVWNSNTTYPYLVGKEDPYEALLAGQIPNYHWTVTFTAAELTELLEASGRPVGTVVDFYISETTPSGNVKKITFVGSNGKQYSLTHQSGVRSFLGLRSMRYTINGASTTTTSGYAVNDTTVNSVDGLYAISGNGAKRTLSGSTYVITGSGKTELLLPSTTTTSTPSTGSSQSGVFVLNGTGWGHHVGMSQWGARAMAEQGCTYDQILKFYYTGIDLY